MPLASTHTTLHFLFKRSFRRGRTSSRFACVSRRRWSNRTTWTPSTRKILTRPTTLARTKTTTTTTTTRWRRKPFPWRGTRWCLPQFLTRRQRGCPSPKACRGLPKSGAGSNVMILFLVCKTSDTTSVIYRYLLAPTEKRTLKTSWNQAEVNLSVTRWASKFPEPEVTE